jgi:hypothetical protein
MKLIIFIIACLPLKALAAYVDFIHIPGHEKQGTILHFNYDWLYKNVSDFHNNMRRHSGYGFRQLNYEKWFVANVGYFMNKYNAWYVYVDDPYTKSTDKETASWIKNAPEDIDITQDLAYGLTNNYGQAKYITLLSGRNIYQLNGIFLNDWSFHLR